MAVLISREVGQVTMIDHGVADSVAVEVDLIPESDIALDATVDHLTEAETETVALENVRAVSQVAIQITKVDKEKTKRMSVSLHKKRTTAI